MVFVSKSGECRPPYPAAFRRDAVVLVRSSGRPIRELATLRLIVQNVAGQTVRANARP
jgi:hypothetical protein